MYSATGEHRSGPGPRGMDLFPVAVSDGRVTIDTSVVVRGLPVGTVVADLSATGPHCLSQAEVEIEH